MKKMFIIGTLFLLAGIAPPVGAQETKREVKEAGKSAGRSIKRGGKKLGGKTAAVASKGKSRITDTEHKDKVGPNGENIYIDNHSRYYWVDKRGRRHYVLESELKDKHSR